MVPMLDFPCLQARQKEMLRHAERTLENNRSRGTSGLRQRIFSKRSTTPKQS